MKIKIKLRTIEEVKNFCDYAEKVECDIYVTQGRYTISAKSIIGIMSFSLLEGLELSVDTVTDDFTEFLEKIKELGIVRG